MLRILFRDEARLLTFRDVGSGVREHPAAFLAFGLALTIVAGVGRHWDDPRAAMWQQLGLGSVAYVFALAFLLWAIAIPLRPRSWSYINVLIFVTLTSPPAFLYAIPVERLFPLDRASSINAVFLGIVATWRVALLFHFMHRVGGLSIPIVLAASLLPLALIVVILTVLNLDHVAFDLMAGIRPEQKSVNDAAYDILFLISMLAYITSPALAILYGLGVYRARRVAPRVTPES